VPFLLLLSRHGSRKTDTFRSCVLPVRYDGTSRPVRLINVTMVNGQCSPRPSQWSRLGLIQCSSTNDMPMNLARQWYIRTPIFFSTILLYRPLPLATPTRISFPSCPYALPLQPIRTVGYGWPRAIPNHHIVLLPRRTWYHRGV